MSFRENGKLALQTVLKQEQNITILDRIIFDLATEQAKQSSELVVDYLYNSYLYQVIGDISNQVKLKDISLNLKNKQVDWDHPSFKAMSDRIAEQNDFIKNPFEVEEGVFQCKAINPATGKICGSRRVYSYTKQDRSCDEGTSVYAQCVACKSKWRERG